VDDDDDDDDDDLIDEDGCASLRISRPSPTLPAP
jgi:hypothetical protein